MTENDAGQGVGTNAEDVAVPASSASPNLDHEIECVCPGRPHRKDTVRLRPKPSLEMAMAARGVGAMADGDIITAYAMLGKVYLVFGVESWTCVGDKGAPLMISPETVMERLTFESGGLAIAEACSTLYGDRIFGGPQPPSSDGPEPGQTDTSTSQTKPSGPRLRDLSKQSSHSDSERTTA